MAKNSPLKLAICSWATGIGGGAARMESFYYNFYDRELIEPHFISLVARPADGNSYDSKIPVTVLDQTSRFGHLCNYLAEHKIQAIQFQGSFDPLVCEAARVTGVPVLVEVLHNIEPGGLYRNIDHIICVSEAVANVQDSGISYSTIQNGIDINEFPFEESKMTTNKIVLLQVARRSKAKINLDDLAPKLIEHFPNLEFIICGSEHHIESTDQIRVKGVVENIQELYQQSDFFVQLSDNESFGLVALEAMSSGVPVILSNSGGFKEIVSDKVDGYLVDGPSLGEAFRVISAAINDRETDKYRAIRVKAREKVLKNFRIEECVKSYQDLILRLYREKSESHSLSASLPLGLSGIPPDALVGEAIYDFHNSNLLGVAEKLSLLANSPIPLEKLQCVKTAHDLAFLLNLKSPEDSPRGIFTYLFFSGDTTKETLEMCLGEIEYINKRGLNEHLQKYLAEI